MTETHATWRAEIESELAEVQSELAFAIKDVSAAQMAHDLAAAEHLKIGRLLSDIADSRPDRSIFGQSKPPLPASLHRKLDPAGQALHLAEGHLTRTKLLVDNINYRISDLQEALTDLDRATAGNEA